MRWPCLSFGQARLTSGPEERVRAVLRAFDQNDLPMGAVERALPPPSVGVTGFVGVYAVFPDQPIRRIEVSYEFGNPGEVFPAPQPLAEPVQIDDLILCDRLRDAEIQPGLPTPPAFGDMPVRLKLRSAARNETPSGGEPGHTGHVLSPFTGLPVEIDGLPVTTDGEVTRAEGTTVKVSAPEIFGGRRFLRWRLSGGVSFGNGLNEIPLTLLRDGALTAVYEGRRLRSVRRPPG